APAGRAAPPVVGTSAAAPVVCWAWASAAAKLLVPALPALDTPVAAWVAAVPTTEGSKAVWREVICAWIWETRLTASVKLIYYLIDRRRPAWLESPVDRADDQGVCS